MSRSDHYDDDHVAHPIYRMPTVFGPAYGPRQAPSGMQYDNVESPKKFCVYGAWLTEPQALMRLLPAGFSLRGEPQVMFEFSYMTEIAWLAGRGYNMLTVRIPVSYQDGDDVIEGFFQPVVWENLTEPILSGREELGWSKIYADLPPGTREHDDLICHAEWMGFRFFEMKLNVASLTDGAPLQSAPVLHHKYVPATERWGQADVDYVTLTPAGGSRARMLDSAVTTRCEAQFYRPRWQDMPTQFSIVHGLADLPLLTLVRAGTYRTVGGKDLSDQRRLAR